MNSTLQQLFEDFQGHKTWLRKCASAIAEAAQGDELDMIIAGLIGKDGAVGVVEPGRTWSREDVWGINIALCNQYCSRERFPMVRSSPVCFLTTFLIVFPLCPEEQHWH